MQATMLAAVSTSCRGLADNSPMRSSLLTPGGSVGEKNGTGAAKACGAIAAEVPVAGTDSTVAHGVVAHGL
jgi:hypothetical protein